MDQLVIIQLNNIVRQLQISFEIIAPKANNISMIK